MGHAQVRLKRDSAHWVNAGDIGQGIKPDCRLRHPALRLLKTGFVCNPITYRQSMTQSLCIDRSLRPGRFEHFQTLQHVLPVALNEAQSRQGCIASYMGFIFPSPAEETQALRQY